MVEGNHPTEAWPQHSLQQLQTAIVNAKEANKYLFVWDKQGSVGTFMQYKGQLAPLAPEVIKVCLNRQTNAEVGEYIRKQFIHAMRQGEKLCFDIETTTPDWAAMTQEGTFDPIKFFDW